MVPRLWPHSLRQGYSLSSPAQSNPSFQLCIFCNLHHRSRVLLSHCKIPNPIFSEAGLGKIHIHSFVKSYSRRNLITTLSFHTKHCHIQYPTDLSQPLRGTGLGYYFNLSMKKLRLWLSNLLKRTQLVSECARFIIRSISSKYRLILCFSILTRPLTSILFCTRVFFVCHNLTPLCIEKKLVFNFSHQNCTCVVLALPPLRALNPRDEYLRARLLKLFHA